MAVRTATTVRQVAGIGAVVIACAAITSCADSRDATPDDTIPRITADSTTTTAPQPTNAPPATTAAPVTTSAPLPLPTQATLPPTLPAPSQPPPPQTASPTAPPAEVVEPQTAPPTTPRPGPTSTIVVTQGEPANCSGDGIGADTGDLTIEDVVCRGGWAIGQIDSCPQGDICEGADVFHVTENGWIHDGYFSILCPESLAEAGMSIYTALAFNPAPCGPDPQPTTNIDPGSTGDRVTQLQISLVGLGYDLNVDGRYGPRTQAAVRDVQRRNGLEVDSIAGPQTQAAIGIGQGAAPAVAATTTTGQTAPTSSAVVTAGQPLACDAETIGADIGRAVGGVTACRGGWAIGPEQCSPSNIDCLQVDVFHVTDDGWVYDGAFPGDCVDDLTVTGMSVHTAAEFAELCADGLPDRENVLPGSTGQDVEQVQIALVAIGYPIAVDGTYGPRTEAAVRDFQAANDLEVDGIAGPDTQEALGL